MTTPADALREVMAFLDGSGELDGRWFGDEGPVINGIRHNYWWRSILRERTATLLQQLADAEREVETERFNLAMLEGRYEEKTAYTVISRDGVVIYCSDLMRQAYSDLTVKLAEYEANNRRYLWLRDRANYAGNHAPIVVGGYGGPSEPILIESELDAAIDAAGGK